ncbi:hypothetical protein GBAR_LOCUS6876 [Geodia barretti]|uniref:Uncharacterized protein n=1 Tax=Geodia barretti TaxID=519541 RepID=A0AA35RHJ4_GEOBA|nr:hypothetical protein GBAR_LOCUS6876 [Geodia barretti]
MTLLMTTVTICGLNLCSCIPALEPQTLAAQKNTLTVTPCRMRETMMKVYTCVVIRILCLFMKPFQEAYLELI